jgi:two-component system chemotaxis response regulator CheB
MYILVVDDSAVARLLLNAIFVEAGHQVLQAADGYQALELLQRHKPDIVTMDVHMPGLNGYETIGRILELYTVPIIILTSSANAKAATTAIQALAAGALAVLKKPAGPACSGFEQQVAELLRTLKLMAEVKVVRRSRSSPSLPVPTVSSRNLASPPALIAIAASAGGPAALKQLLPMLSPDLPWPMLLIQHIAAGFLDSFIDWLQPLSPFTVTVAKHGQQLQARQLYLPPEGFHLVCHTLNKISLLPACPTDLNIPSADLLFNSLARHMARKVIAIQLSGMGQDGAEGCGAIHQAGGTCIVQDPATALIDSMPKAALRISQTDLSLSPEKIAAFINNLTRTARLASSSKESE